MPINKKDIYGFWDLKTIRTKEHDYDWVDEKVLSGSAAFSESQVVYASRTTEVAIGFTATYTLEDNQMYMRFESATFQNLEDTVVTRKIERLTPHEMVLSGVELGTARTIELSFVRRRTPKPVSLK